MNQTIQDSHLTQLADDHTTTAQNIQKLVDRIYYLQESIQDEHKQEDSLVRLLARPNNTTLEDANIRLEMNNTKESLKDYYEELQQAQEELQKALDSTNYLLGQLKQLCKPQEQPGEQQQVQYIAQMPNVA